MKKAIRMMKGKNTELRVSHGHCCPSSNCIIYFCQILQTWASRFCRIMRKTQPGSFQRPRNGSHPRSHLKQKCLTFILEGLSCLIISWCHYHPNLCLQRLKALLPRPNRYMTEQTWLSFPVELVIFCFIFRCSKKALCSGCVWAWGSFCIFIDAICCSSETGNSISFAL